MKDGVKRLLWPAYRRLAGTAAFRRLRHRPGSREELHAYWREPSDPYNRPAAYLDKHERSLLVVDLVARHARTDDRILEIGCGVGRNLEHLRMAGFTRLSGNEISEEALGLLPEAYP
ncbi:MAG: class I SAM-dependent methyltransferase, partial [Actinobacteria bacterium]|nr:class I SAM-dependent methyltransferase [Actinomycetota bacterium]